MKTKTINLYSFEELSESAQQKAINDHRDFLCSVGDFWSGENEQCLKAFCQIFPAKIGRNGLEFIGDDDLSGQRLATYIWNNHRKQIYKAKQYWICEGRPNTVGLNAKHRNSRIFLDELGCPLTGFYLDNEILAPIFDFMRKPGNTSYSELIQNCYSAWEKAIEKDREYQLSDENIIESIKANEYTFTESGKLENA